MNLCGLHLKFRQCAMTALVLLSSSAICRALDISADVYYDKVRGGKLAELIGDWSGLPTEGHFVNSANSANSVSWVLNQTWNTDDDTSVEWRCLHMLETNGLDLIDYRQLTAEWRSHMGAGVFCANAAAFQAMGNGHLPPETGTQALNSYWNNMTRQFEGELFGEIAPGMLLNAKTRSEWWGKVTNEGNAVDTGSFISIICADAFFTSDPTQLIDHAKAFFPTSSLTYLMAEDVENWHVQNSTNWRWCRDQVQNKYFMYNPCPTDWNGCEVNFCSKLIALLYGDGDFTNTIQISVLAGWDCDCNMATIGEIMGTIYGYSGMPANLRDQCGNAYHNTDSDNMPASDTVTNIAAREQALAEQNILARGGTITGTGTNRMYHIVDGAIDQLPFAQAQNLSLMQDTSLGIMLRAMDPYLATLTYTVTVSVAHGTLAGNSTNKLYTPTPGYYGPDSFVFKVNNGSNDSNEATISILVMRTNHFPVASNSSVTTTEDTARPITLVATDVDGDALTFTWSQPGNGTVTGAGSNVVYTPTLYWQGTDSFSFVADDGYLGLATGQVTIVVAHTNHAPVAQDQNMSVLTNRQRAITLMATDADGDTISGYNVTVLPQHGTLGGSGADRTYTPFTAYTGPDSFRFTASDGQTTSAEAIVTITVTDVSPVHQMKITFSGYNKGEALTNFPALVVFSNAMSSGFAYADFASTNGCDLRFKDATETQELNYEPDTWNPSGSSYVWVQVPVLTSNAYIWAYWGDPDMASPPSYTTNGATWTTNYLGVWHMNAPTNAPTDSARHPADHSGSKAGVADDVVTNAMIGNGHSYVLSTGARVAMTNSASLSGLSSATVMFWYYKRSTGGNNNPGPIGYGTVLGQTSANYNGIRHRATDALEYRMNGTTYAKTPDLANSNWYCIGVTFASGTVQFFENGTNCTLNPVGGAGWIAPTYLIGTGPDDSRTVDGIIDEMQICNVVRSPNWIWACWMNQGATSAFNSYGPVSFAGGSSNVPPPVISIVPQPGQSGLIELAWQSAAGATYAVYKTTNLLAGWPAQPLTNNISGDGATKLFSEPVGTSPAAFYRLTAVGN